MNQKPTKNSPEIAAPKEIRAVDTPFLSFENTNGISVYTKEARNYLVLDSDVEYPEYSKDSEINSMLLPYKHIQRERHLELPKNFVTLPQVLNDAIGDNTSTRSLEIAKNAFASLGRNLGRIAIIEHSVPTGLSYKNVIFSRNEASGSPKLLPPINFLKFDETNDREQARVHVINGLRRSVMDGASNTTQQRNILTAFGGFLKNYDW